MLEVQTKQSAWLERFPLLKQFLANRGYQTEAEVQSVLEPTLKDLKDPFQLDGMAVAVDRLVEAWIQKETIGIYADFDLDGTPGLALFYTGLKELGFAEPLRFQPSRLQDGYGLHFHRVSELHSRGASLIVTIDVGITDVEAVARARAEGIDVIITDHHLQGPVLPPALAVVNPNKKDCQSGLGHLCGAGVAFYLLLGTKMGLESKGLLKEQPKLKALLDLFAIGTLTDMVPLVKENRALVRHGLAQLKATARPGLRALLSELSIGKGSEPLKSQDVAIRFAPKLNALSRLEDIDPASPKAIDLMLCQDDFEANRLVKKAMMINQVRQDLQERASQSALAEVRETQALAPVKWVFSPDFHKGIIGLVAMRLVEEFQCPCFVGSEKGDVIHGSARLPEFLAGNLVDVLGAAREVLIGFGGHSHAAGFSLRKENSDLFFESLSGFWTAEKERLQNRDALQSESRLDGTVEIGDLTLEFMKAYALCEPFGKGFEPLVVAIQGLNIESYQVLRGGHLKFQFKDQKGRVLTALLFSPTIAPDVRQRFENRTLRWTVSGEPQVNSFAGRQSVQLMIKSLEQEVG